jgi:hypothetical protein
LSHITNHYKINIMPLSLSNKVQKPLFDFSSLFGTAHTTPALSGEVQNRIAQAALMPIPGIKNAAAASTTPTITGNGASAVSYKGTPIKYGDDASLQSQFKAIESGQNALAPSTGGNIRGLLDAPTGARSGEAVKESPTFSGIIYDLIKKATDQDANVSGARERAEGINTQIEKQKQELANTIAGIQNQAIPLEFQQGRQQVVNQQGASILEALGSQFQGAQGLLDQALTERGQTLGTLESAAGLAAPSQAAFGQTTFNPLTGGYAGGGGLPPEVMQQYAQMAASGQYAAIPSFITSNPVLNAQLNVAAKAYNPNFTPVGAQGASGVLGTIPALQSAETAAEGIKNTITSYLAANPQLNPSDLAAGNILQQWIQGKQLTDPKYQTLFNYLNEYTSTLAPILGVGGDATNLKTQIAQSFINAAASGQSISQVLESLSQLAKNKVIDLQRGAVGQGTVVPPTQSQNTGGFAEAW